MLLTVEAALAPTMRLSTGSGARKLFDEDAWLEGFEMEDEEEKEVEETEEENEAEVAGKLGV